MVNRFFQLVLAAAFVTFVLITFTGCATSCCSVNRDATASGTFATLGLEQAARSSVRIRILCDLRTLGYGSGVAVDPTHVITARHVANATENCADGEMPNFEVISFEGTVRLMHLQELASDKDVDVALFEISGLPFPHWARISYRQPVIGERIWVVAGDGLMDEDGFWPFQVKQGFVSGFNESQLAVGIHGVPGNSGCGFWSEDGELLGVLYAGVWSYQVENWAEGFRPDSWKDLASLLHYP